MYLNPSSWNAHPSLYLGSNFLGNTISGKGINGLTGLRTSRSLPTSIVLDPFSIHLSSKLSTAFGLEPTILFSLCISLKPRAQSLCRSKEPSSAHRAPRHAASCSKVSGAPLSSTAVRRGGLCHPPAGSSTISALRTVSCARQTRA